MKKGGMIPGIPLIGINIIYMHIWNKRGRVVNMAARVAGVSSARAGLPRRPQPFPVLESPATPTAHSPLYTIGHPVYKTYVRRSGRLSDGGRGSMLTKIICLLSILVGGPAGGGWAVGVPQGVRRDRRRTAGGTRGVRCHLASARGDEEGWARGGPSISSSYFFFMPEAESPPRGVPDRNPSREERARRLRRGKPRQPWGVVRARRRVRGRGAADWGRTDVRARL